MRAFLVALLICSGPAFAQSNTPPQAPPATMPSAEITAREVLSILNERTSANDARFSAQEKAVAAALAAAKEAVAKAEAAADKRFELINEFRAQSKDQQALFATRAETTTMIKALEERVQSLDARLTSLIARGEGINWLVGIIGSLVGAVTGLLVAVVAFRRLPKTSP